MVHDTQQMRHPQLLRQIALGRGDKTIEFLAEKFGVSAKTIRRDIADLRELGCAIEGQIRAGGLKTYQLASHHIGQVGFTYDEAFSLLLCRAGTDQFTGTLTSTLEIKSFILSFGPATEVLEPQSLREEIAEELTKASAQSEIGNEPKSENPNHSRYEGINQ